MDRAGPAPRGQLEVEPVEDICPRILLYPCDLGAPWTVGGELERSLEESCHALGEGGAQGEAGRRVAVAHLGDPS